MAKPATKCATLFHLAAFPIYAYSLYYKIYILDMPVPEPNYAYAGKWKYLTVWNLALCAAYFGLCVFVKIIPLKFLMRVRDYIFCSVSLPSCIFVTCSFWGLYAINPDLIMPKKYEALYPLWLNHASHTLVMATAFLEALLHRHEVPSTRRGLTGVVVWFVGYQVWILYLGIIQGVWVYPIMRVLPVVQLTLYFIFNHIVLDTLYLVCSSILRWKNRGSEDDADLELKKVI